MNVILIFFSGLICVTQSRDLGFGERFSSWVRDVPYVGNTLHEKAVQPISAFVDDVGGRFSQRIQRDSPKDLSYFVGRVEELLKRLVPNKNLVQDLMGVPEPESSASSEVSHEINNIIRNEGKRRNKIEHSPMLEPPPMPERKKPSVLDLYLSPQKQPASNYQPAVLPPPTELIPTKKFLPHPHPNDLIPSRRFKNHVTFDPLPTYRTPTFGPISRTYTPLPAKSLYTPKPLFTYPREDIPERENFLPKLPVINLGDAWFDE